MKWNHVKWNEIKLNEMKSNEMNEVNETMKFSDPSRILRFLYDIELSLQSRAHFADFIFQNIFSTLL